MPPVSPPAMLDVTCLRRVRPWGGDPVDIDIADGRIAAIRPAGTAPIGVREFDGRGLLALPGLINAHAHVDKSWWGLPWQSYGGAAGVEGRIRHERDQREALGIPSIERSAAVLEQLVLHGTTAIRTHVDVDTGIGLRAIDAVQQAAEAYVGALDVQLVAFPQDGVLRRPGVLELLRAAASRESVGWIGGLDPASIDRDPVGQIDALVSLALETGAGIDIHLHDPAELGAFQIELLVDRVQRHGLAGRVNIAHGFAVAQLDAVRRRDLLAAMGEAGVSMTTVAPLGGAQLPLADLDAAGVAFGLGTDGIRDLWSPYGTGDILGIAWQYARAGGLVRDDDLDRVVRLATSAAAWAVGRDVHDLIEGARADIVLMDAENPIDALVRQPERALVIAGGKALHVA
ncbi:amidohydrolase family protein [uncultured Microbacterium sp.]|uniref:amidohydrolase family protein n=1 Tax=uncultured Microbacterium sp. TaxID=191216 RepID=UPI0025FECE03|nr:amidohydrolase family protein [uncultured Microbacterium sp.]